MELQALLRVTHLPSVENDTMIWALESACVPPKNKNASRMLALLENAQCYLALLIHLK